MPLGNFTCVLRTNVNTTPFKISLFFTIRQYLYRLFLLSSIISIFQSLLIIALIMINTMTCAMKGEAWTWYLPSHLVPAKILCSRCEPCTYNFYSTPLWIISLNKDVLEYKRADVVRVIVLYAMLRYDMIW